MSKLELKVPPVLIVGFFAVLMWGVSLYTPDMKILKQFNILIFFILSAIGVLFAVMGVVSFRRAKTTVNPTTPEAVSELVTSGIYQYTRNPMYVGFLFMLVGWAGLLSNLYALALCLGFVIYLNRFQIKPEEEVLASIFGEQFYAYKTRVRRWL